MVHWYKFIPGVNEKSEVMESGNFAQNSKTKCRPRFRKNFFQKWSLSIVSTCIFIFCHKFGYHLGINSSHIGISSFQTGINLFHQMFYCIGWTALLSGITVSVVNFKKLLLLSIWVVKNLYLVQLLTSIY